MHLSRLSILVLVVLSLASCGGKESVSSEVAEAQVRADMHARIKELVAEKSRQDMAISAVDEGFDEYGRLLEEIVERRRALRELNADYDATRQGFESLLEKHDMQIREQRERVTAAIARFEAATTPEEWDQLIKVTTDAMIQLTKTIGAI